MALLKRKSDGYAGSSRPEKKAKSSSSTTVTSQKEEEPAFPRGGASILTPLEHKQIQIQAKNDVLFEQKSGKKLHRDGFEDEKNEERMAEDQDTVTKPKRKNKVRGKKGGTNGTIEEAAVRIEGLSYNVSKGDIYICFD